MDVIFFSYSLNDNIIKRAPFFFGSMANGSMSLLCFATYLMDEPLHESERGEYEPSGFSSTWYRLISFPSLEKAKVKYKYSERLK